MRIIAIIILSLSFSFHISAQKKSYLVTTQLDTLQGKLSIQLGGQYQVDRVRIKMGKEKKYFDAFEIRVIQDKNQKYYPIKFNGRYQFVQVEKEGSFLSLYRYIDQSTNNSQYAGKLLVSKDGQQHIVSNIGFKKKLAEFLVECEEVQNEVENGDYGRNDLYKIMDEYNACIESKSSRELEKLANVQEASQIEALIETVEGMDREDKDELIEMLTDVKGKLKDGEKIPGYLQSAIKEKLAGEEALLKLFEEIVE
ncbi:hypothetical protein [Reichenbachiella ulvae]|uniref:DUF4369 domain-containing protein n=1 Tax=Reichenbachiella ulvae TaxID=2980104 RepID=A0ABT3CWY8_9BACT|nr:hypothetical protein [Reichenbachiella ulvae]MCV9388221.1 hypothetical protein [Reichenbachiella ulvae]